jgi:hypothetical protein
MAVRCLHLISFTAELSSTASFAVLALYKDIVSISFTENGDVGGAFGLDLLAGETICRTTSLQMNLVGDIDSYFLATARMSYSISLQKSYDGRA